MERTAREDVGGAATRGALAPRRATPLLLAGVLAGFAFRLALIVSGRCDRGVVADDAYYYFTIARHLAAGAGPTFDGLAPTNGFHPLYQFLLVPVFALARGMSADPVLPVHGALVLCAVFDAATAWLLATILGRLGQRTGGTVAAWLWSLSPVSALLTLRGLEGSVSAFAVCLVLLALTARDGPWSHPARAFRLGAAVGLALLARTDNGPLVALAVLAFELFDPRHRGPARRLAAAGVAAFGGALVVTGPWLLWNLVTFGNMVQVSGLAKAHNKYIYGALPELHGAEAFAGWIARLGAPVLFLCRFVAGEDARAPNATFAWLGVAVAVLAFGLLVVGHAWRAPRSPLDRPLLAFAAAFVVAHLALYGFVLGIYVVWYATVPLLLVTLALGGIGGGRVAAASPRAGRIGWCVVLVAAGVVCYRGFFHAVDRGPRPLEAAQVLRAVRERFPTVRTVGCFNAGAIGYFVTARSDLRVVNLDGLVNNRLYDAWRHARVLPYLEQTVDLIVMDAPETMRAWLRDGEWERLTAEYPQAGRTVFYGPRRAAPAP